MLHKYREHLLENIKTHEGIVKFEKSLTNSEMINVQSSQQKMPLLDAEVLEDSDDPQNDNQNTSEIIFDVLKSRDTRR